MLKKIFHSDKEIIKRIRTNDRSVLGEIFLMNQKPVISYIKKNGGDQSDAQDMLQEAIIVLWQNITSGHYEQTARISTYLFAIAKNKWMAESRRRHKLDFDLQKAEILNKPENSLDMVVENEENEIVNRALLELGSPCRELLLMFYFEERKMEEIAALLGFANRDVVKAKKYQCKKALQKILNNYIKLER